MRSLIFFLMKVSLLRKLYKIVSFIQWCPKFSFRIDITVQNYAKLAKSICEFKSSELLFPRSDACTIIRKNSVEDPGIPGGAVPAR